MKIFTSEFVTKKRFLVNIIMPLFANLVDIYFVKITLLLRPPSKDHSNDHLIYSTIYYLHCQS